LPVVKFRSRKDQKTKSADLIQHHHKARRKVKKKKKKEKKATIILLAIARQDIMIP